MPCSGRKFLQSGHFKPSKPPPRRKLSLRSGSRMNGALRSITLRNEEWSKQSMVAQPRACFNSFLSVYHQPFPPPLAALVCLAPFSAGKHYYRCVAMRRPLCICLRPRQLLRALACNNFLGTCITFGYVFAGGIGVSTGSYGVWKGSLNRIGGKFLFNSSQEINHVMDPP